VPDIVIHVIACAAYVGLAWHFWSTRWRHQASGGLRGWERAAILVPLLLHGWLLYDGIFAAPELRFGFAQALSVMTWLAVLAYWSESLLYNLDGMEPLVLLAAAATVTLPAFFPGLASSGAHAQATEFKLHLVLAMAAYGLFVIALVHALLMLAVERGLHSKRIGFAGNLPPLLTLEHLLFRAIGAAFILLTLTLVTGIAFSETLFGRAWRSDHKTIFAVLSWLTFGWLLVGRWRYGWRGRTAVRWTLGGFVLLVLAYVGSRFVLEVLLHRA
jgi:ABC-type uncharacterized transport system permease subunit